jgi:hypothetical protein
MDGVTTALELEVGASPVNEWYVAREGKSLIHFGASAGPIPARMTVMHDTGGFVPRDAALNRAATPEEQQAIQAAVQKGFEEGALGLGLGIEMAPMATPGEILNLFQLSAKWKRPVFVHLRRPGSRVIESLQEVIADAFVAGVPLHVTHIAGTSGRRSSEALALVESARSRGLDITAETYPYTGGAALIESGLFDPGWQENREISYLDLMWPATGERLTQDSFARYRKQGGAVIMFLNTEDTIRTAVAHPLTMIASDGGIRNGRGHPRGAGTYARVLGKYVREERALSLMDAIRKSSPCPRNVSRACRPRCVRKVASRSAPTPTSRVRPGSRHRQGNVCQSGTVFRRLSIRRRQWNLRRSRRKTAAECLPGPRDQSTMISSSC